MPNIKSAIKRVKVSAKKAANNTALKSSMKTAIRKVEKAAATNDKAQTSEQLNVAIKRIDKAATSGLIHKNKAARQKSRLTKMSNRVE